MAKTKISWCDYTFNPWIGCAKVAPECKFCYAEQLMDKQYKKAEWGLDGTRNRTSVNYWRDPYKWNKFHAMTGTVGRVFCASLADVFEYREDLDPIREDLWKIIEETPFLDWLLLTKRPANIFSMIPEKWMDEGAPQNIWFGASMGTQDAWNRFAPLMVHTKQRLKAKCVWASMEPLLEPVKIGPGMDWVVIGGESGNHKDIRRTDPEWIWSLIDDCHLHKSTIFVKQLGKKLAAQYGIKGKSEDWDKWPACFANMKIREWPFPATRGELFNTVSHNGVQQ